MDTEKSEKLEKMILEIFASQSAGTPEETTLHTINLLDDLTGDKENITTDDIVEIALDIMEHSNTEQELTSICFDVARIAVTFFEEV